MSASSYLTWVLAGLFVVCGLPLIAAAGIGVLVAAAWALAFKAG
jgi:hypothetical protein